MARGSLSISWLRGGDGRLNGGIPPPRKLPELGKASLFVGLQKSHVGEIPLFGGSPAWGSLSGASVPLGRLCEGIPPLSSLPNGKLLPSSVRLSGRLCEGILPLSSRPNGKGFSGCRSVERPREGNPPLRGLSEMPTIERRLWLGFPSSDTSLGIGNPV